MVDVAAISGTLSAFKSLKDLAETLVAIRDAETLQAKRLEFQSRLIDAQAGILALQEERSSLLERVRELEKEIADLKAWESEKQRYELKELPPGVYVRALKRRGMRVNLRIIFAKHAISAATSGLSTRLTQRPTEFNI